MYLTIYTKIKYAIGLIETGSICDFIFRTTRRLQFLVQNYRESWGLPLLLNLWMTNPIELVSLSDLNKIFPRKYETEVSNMFLNVISCLEVSIWTPFIALPVYRRSSTLSQIWRIMRGVTVAIGLPASRLRLSRSHVYEFFTDGMITKF